MLEFAATVFITFLVIIDPVGMLPLFVALTHRQNNEQRRRTAIKSITTAAITLVVMAFVGHIVLRFLGIGLPAFRIAGGLLVLLLSVDMVSLLDKAVFARRRPPRPRRPKTAPMSPFFLWPSRLLPDPAQ